MEFFQKRLTIFALIPDRQSYTGGSLIRRAVCGNGIVEPGEDCDCDRTKNKAECEDLSKFGCCDLSTCEYKGFGEICRYPSNSVCDKAELCYGDSSICLDDEWWRDKEGWNCAPPQGEPEGSQWACNRGVCRRKQEQNQNPPEEEKPPENTTTKSEPKTTTPTPSIAPTTSQQTQKDPEPETQGPKPSITNPTNSDPPVTEVPQTSQPTETPEPSNNSVAKDSDESQDLSIVQTFTTTDPSGTPTTITTTGLRLPSSNTLLPSPVSSETETNPPSQSVPTGYSKTTVIGVAIGASLGVLLLTILAVFIFLRRKKNNAPLAPTPPVVAAEMEDTGKLEVAAGERRGYISGSTVVGERSGYVSGSTVVGEMEGDHGAVEIDGRGLMMHR